MLACRFLWPLFKSRTVLWAVHLEACGHCSRSPIFHVTVATLGKLPISTLPSHPRIRNYVHHARLSAHLIRVWDHESWALGQGNPQHIATWRVSALLRGKIAGVFSAQTMKSKCSLLPCHTAPLLHRC